MKEIVGGIKWRDSFIVIDIEGSIWQYRFSYSRGTFEWCLIGVVQS